MFSELYQQPKTLADIHLDHVIMAPSMVKPLDDIQKDRMYPVVYVLAEEWAFDGDYGNLSEVYSDFEDAKRIMVQKVSVEKESGCIPRWIENSTFVEESSQNFYACYLNGDYEKYHYSIAITERKMCTSPRFMCEMSDRYNADCQLEDFAAHVEVLEEMDRLTDKQRERMLHDPQFPKRFQDALSKNDCYWECYWETLSVVAYEFILRYLLDGARPECYTPENATPYSLCTGQDCSECMRCPVWTHFTETSTAKMEARNE